MRDSGRTQMIDDAVALAEQIVKDADKGRVDLADLGRRARKLLESTSTQGSAEPLF